MTAGWLTSLPFAFGVVACFTGGWFSDAIIRRWGKRWGRRIVGAMGLTLAGAAILTVPWVDNLVALGWLLAGGWPGALFGLVWGGLARIFLVHHVTWSVNSVCHLWGKRPFRSPDESRNNLVFGILAMGEGWHQGHHTFPTSARHGLSWWKIDVSYWVIRALGCVGLAWDVRLPTREARERERRVP